MRNNEKIQKFIIIGIVIVAILIITISANFIKAKSNSNSQIEESKDSESVSTQIGKTPKDIEDEAENEIEFETADLITNSETSQNETTINNTVELDSNSNIVKDTADSNNTSNNHKKSEETASLTCVSPISGTIIRDFAKDSLVYSDTLKEWITHKGIDIKADKTSVVSAVADGKVYAIKNDPRYGLTVIINHNNGFQSIYSNLLTSEFVVEGEEIKSGQSIGTVGNSASFEILDDYHLHFELLQNNEYLDPTIYINFD